MELHEYPRPANDTGIGVHWTVGFASAIGIGQIRDQWLPELKAMGVKWVKIFNHDGAIDFAELLLAEGIMPVVRLYRPAPNPSTLDIREIVHLDALIRAGVRYFEFNHEPDVDSEWKGGRVPANAIDLVVENTIANMDLILERGGMPGIPATANGSRWDLVGKIVARGRKDLLNGPVWQAIHNYSRNRPLDYPYDIGNQEGAAYTQRFYQTIANESWGEDAWRGRSLQEVNRLRLHRCNPGGTIMDDPACWLAYEFFDARIRRHLGRSLPILSTECGYLVGEDGDPRYPATTPDLHMAQTLETCRVMMGTSQRFPVAPDYYFCSAFWLVGNALLGSSSTWCEHHAWYSDRWAAGRLPVVAALKAEPKAVRRWQGNVLIGALATLRGTVLNAGAPGGTSRTLILTKGGAEVARATLDANSRYYMPDIPPGSYTLRVEGTLVEEGISLTPGQEAAVVDLDLAALQPQLNGSILAGRVRGGATAVVLLLRTGDGEEWITLAKDDGAFRFVDLPPGLYSVRAQGGSRVEGIDLDGGNRREVELSMAGWGHTIRAIETTGARPPVVRCTVEGQTGLSVRVQAGEWSSAPVQTGSAPEIGSGGCEIGPLEPGHYVVEVTGLRTPEGKPLKLDAYVQVERRVVPMVEFVYTDPAQTIRPVTANSVIRGRVIGGCTPERELLVRLTDEQAQQTEQTVAADCTFAFTGLGPGLYTVELVGYAEAKGRRDITLDGRNTVTVELLAPLEDTPRGGNRPPRGHSLIGGYTPDAAGRIAKLTDAVGSEYRTVVDVANRFRFDNLPAGRYALTIEGGYALDDLAVDGSSGLLIALQELVGTWEAKVSPAGSMPGYSVARVEVEGMRGLAVYIWKEDWEGMMRRTGTKPEYGECAAEFSPLGPGHYMVEPEGLGLWADVELTGLEVVWIEFRRKAVPSSPHRVEELTATARAALLAPAVAPPPAAPPAAGDAVPVDDAAVTGFEEEPAPESDAAPDAEPDDGWPRRMTSDFGAGFTLPTLTLRDEDDEDDEAYFDLEDDEETAADATAATVEDGKAAEMAAPGAEVTPAADAHDVQAAPGKPPLCLLVPEPVTDREDLAALLDFMATDQPLVVSTVDEVPAGSEVLLLPAADAETTAALEAALAARGFTYERVTGKLAQVLAARHNSDLY